MRFILLGTLLVVCCSSAAAEGVIAKKVLYVGNASTPRAMAFEEFLRSHFAHVTVANRASFNAVEAADADVVLLDWSQQDTPVAKADSPLGPRDVWSTPTVLLGSAGLLLASSWEILGGGG